MTGSLQPLTRISKQNPAATYAVTGTSTTNDGQSVPGVALIDPATGLPYAASGGSGGGGGAVTLIDGADVTQGASTDTATSLTIMGRLLKFIALFPTSLGAKTSANSLAVVLASDQATLNSSQKAQNSLAVALCTNVTHTGPEKALGSQTVGTTQATIAHGLGYTPTEVVITPTTSQATGSVWRSAASDATNIFLTATAAGITCDVFVR